MAQDRTIDFHETVVLDERPEVADGTPPLGKITEDHQKRDSTGSANGKRLARAKIIAPIVVLLLAGAATLAYRHYAGWESTDDAQIDGYINPISSRVAGYITNVYVDDNPGHAGQRSGNRRREPGERPGYIREYIKPVDFGRGRCCQRARGDFGFRAATRCRPGSRPASGSEQRQGSG